MSDAARDIVKEIIHGDLQETSYTETIYLESSLKNLPLEHSPITSVQSVSVDGSAFSDFTRTHFTLRRNDLTLWPAGVKIIVDYKTGWEPNPLPSEIELALEHVDTWLAGNPQSGIVEATIGPMTTRKNESGLKTPETVKGLLQRWIRPLY